MMYEHPLCRILDGLLKNVHFGFHDGYLSRKLPNAGVLNLGEQALRWFGLSSMTILTASEELNMVNLFHVAKNSRI